MLPWISSHNLGSRLLSMITKCLPDDWHNRYRYQPVLLESFVENEHVDAHLNSPLCAQISSPFHSHDFSQQVSEEQEAFRKKTLYEWRQRGDD